MKEKILEKIKKIYNRNDFEICKSWFETKKRKISFRINTLKISNEEIEKILTEKWLKFKKIDFLKNAYILKNWKEKDLWDLSIFNEWKIYLQSISSQIPVNLIEIKENMKVLDLTAAPWWKTSQVATKMKNSWEIIAVDNNAIRIDKLNFTLKRQGIKNTKVIKNDAKKLIEKNPNFINYFDIIIADLPCSAEWKINFHKEKSFAFWNENIPKKNAKLQKSILKNTISMLKKNWVLIYSTCAISPEENEDIIHFLLCNFPELKLEKIDLDYKYARNWLKTFENKHFKKEISENVVRILASFESEGFFVAKLKKCI